MKEKVKNTMTAIGGIGLLISLLLLCPALAESEEKNPPVRVHANPKVVKPITPTVNYVNYYTYSDAIEAIMDSDMWSEDLSNAIDYINNPRIRMCSENYRAICKVVESCMLSEDMADSIGRICGY